MPEGRHNAVIYNRVSTQDQIERTDLNSLISHEERCLHYIQAQGWPHLRTHEDPALSASSLNRPQLQRLLLDLREGHIDYVIVYKLDRLSRSVKDFHTLLERVEAAHVNLVSVTQGFDTSTPAGRLLRNILMDFAEFEREMISERTKDKMLARAQKRGCGTAGIRRTAVRPRGRSWWFTPKRRTSSGGCSSSTGRPVP
jgi:site-specific DNA recombinase